MTSITKNTEASLILDASENRPDNGLETELLESPMAATDNGTPLSGKLTLITSTKPATLGKTFKLNSEGKLEKTTAGNMAAGTYEVKPFSNIEDLCSILSAVRTDQAITASIPRNLSLSGKIVTKGALKRNPTAIARTKEYFGLFGPGVMILDYDPPDGGMPFTQQQLWDILQTIVPEVCHAGVAWWSSSSSNLKNGNQEIQGLKGQRLYILVKNAADIERADEVLAQRLWLAGHGRIEISKSGSMLKRHVFDDAMAEVARLDFCGGAICEPPLIQVRGQPVILSGGGWLDTKVALPDLETKELNRFKSLQESAKTKAEPLAKAQQDIWKSERLNGLTKVIADKGVNMRDAEIRAKLTLSTALKGMLLADFEIKLEDGSSVTVGTLLENRELYHGQLTYDPLEPEYQGGKVVGKLYLNSPIPTLHSFAHGGTTYKLKRQSERIYLLAGRKADTADEIVKKLESEPDIFMRGGILVRCVPGKLIPIKSPSDLCYVVASRYELYRKDKEGNDCPADLSDSIAKLTFSSLGI